MLVSAIQQSESAMCVHISPPPLPALQAITEHRAEVPALYTTAPGTGFVGDRVSMDGVGVGAAAGGGEQRMKV